jgi:error-prone DNA polymerase
MTAAHEVVEDHGHVGLSLRRHRASFVRADLAARKIMTCAEAMQARDGNGWKPLALSSSANGPAAPRAFCSLRLRTRAASLIWDR